jgi:hypothetical protein
MEEGEEQQGEEHQKNPNRVRGGKKAARTKGQHVHGGDDENDEDQGKDPTRVQAGKKAASHFSHKHFVELGKKGAEARIQKYHQNRRGGSQDESENESENEGESHPDFDSHGKNPRRAEVGRKGAAARWGKESSYDQQDDKDRFDYGEESSKQTGRYRSKREADTNIESPSKRTRHLVY